MRRRARPRFHDSAWQSANASQPRLGRIKRQVRRAFIANDDRPLTARDLLAWCYPRLKRFLHWHRWSLRRVLVIEGRKVGRLPNKQGRPFLWTLGHTENPRDAAVRKPP